MATATTTTTSYYRKGVTMSMDICGRVSVSPSPDFDEVRLTAVSKGDMNKILDDVKSDQAKNVVMDTLAALVTDVNATTEVLRRKHQKPQEEEKPIKVKEPVKPVEEMPVQRKEAPKQKAAPMPPPSPPPPKKYIYETEYRLHLNPNQPANQQQPLQQAQQPFPDNKARQTPIEDRPSVERVLQEYGVPPPDQNDPNNSLRKRARSETPMSGRVIQIEGSKPSKDHPICAACGQEITGPCITALAPNSTRAQKFHPEHFVCTYCQKALNQHGTYREHDKKPYCHDCFYRLFSGLIYSVDNKNQITL